MHLGTTPWQFERRDASTLQAQASFAESLGYESFWLPENHFNEAALPDPLMLLASVAGATERLKLATTSYLLTLRHPLQAAEQVAVLDQLCEGRLILGVGRGFAPDMLMAFNVNPAQKRKIFEASLEVMCAAWRGDAVAVGDGDGEVRLNPLPVQRPHPPIWVAAFGPKALAQAGRLGFPYLASPIETKQVLADNYARHGQAAVDAGRGKVAVVPIMRSVFVCENRREADAVRDRLSKMENSRISPDASVDDWAVIGDEGFVRDALTEYRETLGMTHLVATRLRIGGLPEARIRASLEAVARIGKELA